MLRAVRFIIIQESRPSVILQFCVCSTRHLVLEIQQSSTVWLPTRRSPFATLQSPRRPHDGWCLRRSQQRSWKSLISNMSFRPSRTTRTRLSLPRACRSLQGLQRIAPSSVPTSSGESSTKVTSGDRRKATRLRSRTIRSSPNGGEPRPRPGASSMRFTDV